eukprot:TRINITY_DN3526_c0_g3_i1.p1 TRINITY_DN3526_c0_g3~~TRINITY_DN3526_c0_g3_i1.p1  ORF type:complete len:420 (-),score=86.63 TRINITY_DN3526_c0_g3_i1:74-1333(-)
MIIFDSNRNFLHNQRSNQSFFTDPTYFVSTAPYFADFGVIKEGWQGHNPNLTMNTFEGCNPYTGHICHQTSVLKEEQFDEAPQPSNLKNTYIRKINALLAEIKPEYENTSLDVNGRKTRRKGSKNKNVDTFALVLNDLKKNRARLQKNRESARDSRKRKKLFMELLEEKVAKLERELEEKTDLIAQHQELVILAAEFTKELQEIHISKDIMSKIFTGKLSEAELERYDLEAIKEHLNADCFHRKRLKNYLFSQFYEQLVPDNLRYFIAAAKGKKGPFATEDEVSQEKTSLWSDTKEIFPNTQAESKKFGEHYEKLIAEVNKIQECLESFQKFEQKIGERINSFQNVVTEMSTILSPEQIDVFLAMGNHKEKPTIIESEAESSAKSDEDELPPPPAIDPEVIFLKNYNFLKKRRNPETSK